MFAIVFSVTKMFRSFKFFSFHKQNMQAEKQIRTREELDSEFGAAAVPLVPSQLTQLDVCPIVQLHYGACLSTCCGFSGGVTVIDVVSGCCSLTHFCVRR